MSELEQAVAEMAHAMTSAAECFCHLQCAEADSIARVLLIAGFADEAHVVVAGHAVTDFDDADQHRDVALAMEKVAEEFPETEPWQRAQREADQLVAAHVARLWGRS